MVKKMNKYTLMGVVAFSTLLLSPLAMASTPFPLQLRVFNRLDQPVTIHLGTNDASATIGSGTIPANGFQDVNINVDLPSVYYSVESYVVLDFYTNVNGVDTHIGGYRYLYYSESGMTGEDIYHDFWPTSTNQSDSNWRVEPSTANAKFVSCSGSDFQNCRCTAAGCYTELYIKTKQQQGD